MTLAIVGLPVMKTPFCSLYSAACQNLQHKSVFMDHENINAEEFASYSETASEVAHTVQTVRKASERSETMFKLW